MIEFLLLDANSAFTIALCIMLGLALLEVIGVVLGLSAMSWIDEISPFDVSADASAGGLSSWLSLHKVPLYVWLILFCTLFSLIGLSANYISFSFFGHPLPSLVREFAVLIATFFVLPTVAKPVARFMPNVQTAAVSHDSFSGCLAVVSQDNCRVDRPVEACFKDANGTEQYVLVVPSSVEQEFQRNQEVVLVEKNNQGFWIAIPYSDNSI